MNIFSENILKILIKCIFSFLKNFLKIILMKKNLNVHPGVLPIILVQLALNLYCNFFTILHWSIFSFFTYDQSIKL